MLRIDICNEHAFPLDEARLKKAVRAVLKDAGFENGEISIAVVDDAEMHALNRKYLDHDYPTDVLSFVLEQEEKMLCGEIIVSSDYAEREAKIYIWMAEDELLLYVIHGALHLVGYDDLRPAAKRKMREQERHYLSLFGLVPHYQATKSPSITETPKSLPTESRTPGTASSARFRGKRPPPRSR